ncbi:hypothetical protein O181_095363 [Austropuccinia psidii MF-1]|uniref:Integrase catalytic domain-containing protein n=1 Tax=Austropuccinia psidii MF-1 TaxID=1389203 RepID=A0A9Q3PB48_9BASI|nr:hypothetical protein [Austropuccinia psidii MF-1]
MCKFPQLPFQHLFQKTTSLLENIHIDLCGPIQTPSLSWAKYFMILVDQFLGYIGIKFRKKKSKAFTHFRNFEVYAEKKLNRKILNITSDGGGEFNNKSFTSFTKEQGINHVISPPYMPQHNEIAEQGNRSVIEKTRCLLLKSKLPTQYWAEVAETATMLCNLTRKGSKTPYELWHKIYPPIDKLRPFWCKTWVRIPDSARAGKFDAVAWEGIMLGYANQALAYWILRVADKLVVISRHIKFDESSFPSLSVDTPSVPMEFPYVIFVGENKEISLEADTGDLTPKSTPDEDVFHDALEELPVRRIKVIGPQSPMLITSNISTDNILPFSQRAHTTTKDELDKVPRNYNESNQGKDAEKWKAAMMKELDNIKRLNVWEVVDRKPYDHPITTTWVFKGKHNHNNSLTENKARLCAQRFHQIEGLDYLKTFSPMGKISSL